MYDSESTRPRPERLIVNLLCQVCSLLKSKGWVTRFGASVGSDTSFVCHDSDSTYGSTSVGEVFVVQADLTNTGWEMRYEVVTCVLQYLNFLSGYYPHDSLIDEYNTSLLMKYYRLFDKIGELYFFAQGLAVNMLKAPTKHALSLHFEYVFGKKPEMDGILRLLTPQNMRVDCLSKPFTETEFQQESYFGAKYKIEDIPLEYITKWQKNSIDIDLSFPALNEFMPSEFLSKIELFRSSGQNSSQFELCMDEDFGKLFHSENSSAIWPLAEFNIYTNVPDIKSQWSSKIFIEMIKEDLSAILYNGAEACIDAIISFGDNNILELRFNGFGEKLKDFISKIWQSFGLFTPTKECFKIMKDKMQSEFISRDLNEQAFQLLSNKLTEDITLDDKLDWLKKITFEDVQHINFSSKFYVVAVCSGNLSREESRDIFNIFKPSGVLNISNEGKTKTATKKVTPGIPLKIIAKPKSEYETNFLAKVFFQISEEEDSDKAFLVILKSIIKEYLYLELRLKEQLGYDVTCDVRLGSDLRGFFVSVISPIHKPESLLTRIYSVMGRVREYLGRLSESSFEKYKRTAYKYLADDDSGM